MNKISFPRLYPVYHHLAGENTSFAAAVLQSLNAKTKTRLGPDTWPMAIEISRVATHPKHHQVVFRPFYYSVGDKFLPQISMEPGNNIEFFDPIEIVSVWTFDKREDGYCLNGDLLNGDSFESFAHNEGFNTAIDFESFYSNRKPFVGALICWNKEINY